MHLEPELQMGTGQDVPTKQEECLWLICLKFFYELFYHPAFFLRNED